MLFHNIGLYFLRSAVAVFHKLKLQITRIEPYAPVSLDPSAMVFHYGQEMFEGLKAYKTEDGRILMFRPDKNIERANNSNRRLMIPEIPAEDFLQDKHMICENSAEYQGIFRSRNGLRIFVFDEFDV